MPYETIQTMVHLEKRAETGPLQFGSDWPGVFIRGDDCLGYANSLESFLRHPDDALSRVAIAGLLSLLKSSNLNLR